MKNLGHLELRKLAIENNWLSKADEEQADNIYSILPVCGIFELTHIIWILSEEKSLIDIYDQIEKIEKQ